MSGMPRFILMSCLAVALAACRERAHKPASAPAPRAVFVEALLLEPRPIHDRVLATGAVEPVRRTVLSAEVTGTIASIDIEIGQTVEAPDPKRPKTKARAIAAIDTEAYAIARQRTTALRNAADATLREAKEALEREQERLDDKVLFEEPLRDARFGVQVAKADRDLAAATHRDAARELKRRLALFQRGVDAEAQLDAARAAEETAQAKLQAAEAALALAQEQLRRQENVFASKKLSRKALDVAAARHAAAAARLASANAELDAAQKDLDDCRIVAPFTGRIAQKHVEVGQRVAPGTPIVTLVDVAKVKVRLGLPDVERVKVKLGMSANVRVDAYRGLMRRGTVTALAPTAAEDTGTFAVEVTLDNDPKDGLLLPGMIARVELIGRRYEHALLVPRAALLGNGKERYAYVFEPHPQAAGTAKDEFIAGVARRRRAVVDHAIGNEVLLVAGAGAGGDTDRLRAGDRIVVAGHRRLRDGLPIRIRATPPAKQAKE